MSYVYNMAVYVDATYMQFFIVNTVQADQHSRLSFTPLQEFLSRMTGNLYCFILRQ